MDKGEEHHQVLTTPNLHTFFLMMVCVCLCLRAVRQEEKRRLLRRNNELKNEHAYLEEQDKKLKDTLKVRTEQAQLWSHDHL